MHLFPEKAVYLRPEARFNFEENLTRTISYLPLLTDKGQ